MKELNKLALILRALGIEANVVCERITYKGAFYSKRRIAAFTYERCP